MLRGVRGGRALLVLLLACMLVPVALARSSADRVARARADGVVAQIAYDTRAQAVVHLTIRRHATVVLDGRVPPFSHMFTTMLPLSAHGGKPVVVRDLDGDGEPEVLLDFFWGGAHCCWWSRLYRWSAEPGRYRGFAHLWGDLSYRIRDLDGDGHAELVTGDDRFAYAFASFADSGFPVRIFTYRDGRLRETTRTYPGLVREDAARQWSLFRRARGRRAVRGVLAAWTADECLLGRCGTAFARLRRLGAALSSRLEQERTSNAAYLQKLRAFLRETGYER